jgi:DnaK suppressor protein
MDKKERQAIAASLQEQLEQLSREIAAMRPLLRPVATQCSKTDPQRAEQMQAQELIYKKLTIAEKRYNRLLYIQKKLDDEQYGLCKECDEAIAFERLLLLPETEYCVDCANERER